MHRVDRSLLLPYSSAQMFALVRDVAAYPQFLPWCPATQVRAVAAPDAPPGLDVIEARVEISYLGVRSHFTTRNTNQAPERIELQLVDGPFRRLHGQWHFRALDEQACKVSLVLEYNFAGGLLGRAIAPVFEMVANSLIDAFAARARSLYGEGAMGADLAAG